METLIFFDWFLNESALTNKYPIFRFFVDYLRPGGSYLRKA